MSASLLAIVTTVHLSMFVVRQHRSRPIGGQMVILLPALLCSALVWMAPEAPWIVAGLGAHLAWFAFCEVRFATPAVQAGAAARVHPAATRTGAALSAPRTTAASTAAARRDRTSRPAGSKTVPVLAIVDETHDIKTFRMMRPEGFDFTAGQFLAVGVLVDGKSVQRAYSISSAPHARGYLEISVKRIGLVSSVLHASIRPGGMITVRPPAGSFVYPAGDDRPVILLAGGIGITPLISMLRHAVETEPSRPISLLYSVRRPEDLAFRDELAVIGRRYPQVRIAISVTQGSTSHQWHSGRITAALVRAHAQDLLHALAYICGPQPMIDAMKALMAELGVPEPQIRSESFRAAMKFVSEQATETPKAVGGRVVVRFARSGREAQVHPAETLLDAAEAHGVDIPSVCRAGSCHTCRTRLNIGDVCCDSDSLSENERAEGFILPCVSRARGDCELEA